MHTGVFHQIDLNRDGKTISHIGLPFSVDRSPYYRATIPICVIRNGEGPSALLMAGAHGDEYEGELLLARLIRRLEPQRVRGRVTILPLANAPAVMAGRRRSPLDEGNLNRAFPGDPDAPPTRRLAHFLEAELIPRHDVLFDIHSGGTTLAHLPSALIETNDDQARHAVALDLMQNLGMPFGFIADNGPFAPTSMGAARRAGAISVSGEYGGGATTTPLSMRRTAEAIDRLMLALRIVEAPTLVDALAPAPPMRLLSLARDSQSLYAARRGWFEPAKSLGESVRAGETAGWLHDLERLEDPEEELRFAEDGIVLSMRLPTLCEPGDCLVQVAEELRT